MQLIQISLIVSILTTVGVNAQTDSISFGIQKENLLTTEEIMNLPEIEKEDDGVWRIITSLENYRWRPIIREYFFGRN